MKCGLSELDYYCAHCVVEEGGAAWMRRLRMRYEQQRKGMRKGIQE